MQRGESSTSGRHQRHVADVATERLWLTQPARRTALAKVVAVRGDHFALDRSLFAPTSRAHRHPQPQDKGIVWVDGGEKRLLVEVQFRYGVLWHRLRGTRPVVGSTLNCQLDQDRRDQASRAHTAMHLLLAASRFAGEPAPALLADPEVKGGASFRLEFERAVAPTALAAWLAQANAWVREDKRVARDHVLRSLAPRTLDTQLFDPADPYPGPADVLDAVRIDGVAAYPCDGTHVERTGKVGTVEIAHAKTVGRRFTVVGRVR